MNQWSGKATITFSGVLEVDINDLDIDNSEAPDEQGVEDIVREWAFDEIKQNGASCSIDKISFEDLELEAGEEEPEEAD